MSASTIAIISATRGSNVHRQVDDRPATLGEAMFIMSPLFILVIFLVFFFTKNDKD